MPLYEYECTKCGERVEKLRAVRERSNKATCECGGGMLPLITTPATPVMDPVKPVRRPSNM
jgi:putative FmdB family regulatory protein